jgi:hypothetical protein
VREDDPATYLRVISKEPERASDPFHELSDEEPEALAAAARAALAMTAIELSFTTAAHPCRP